MSKLKSMPVGKFLLGREAGYQATVKAVNNNPSMIVIAPPDEIICDLCNDLVDEDPVWFDSWGLYCPKCREKRKK